MRNGASRNSNCFGVWYGLSRQAHQTLTASPRPAAGAVRVGQVAERVPGGCRVIAPPWFLHIPQKNHHHPLLLRATGAASVYREERFLGQFPENVPGLLLLQAPRRPNSVGLLPPEHRAGRSPSLLGYCGAGLRLLLLSLRPR